LIGIIFTLLFTSCVGEIQSENLDVTSFQDPFKKKFAYQGIVEARAISHDKIEIDFFEAGAKEDYVHLLYVNDSTTPTELQLDTIKKTANGAYRYVLKNRSINTSYKLKIRAQNIKENSESEGEVESIVTTFDNTTAEFDGISQVTFVPGATSSSAIIDWNPAKFIGTISATAYDPVYYEVTMISEVGGVDNLNNGDYTGLDRKVFRVPSSGTIGPSNHPSELKVTSLTPETTYYIQVRAIHKTWNDYFINDPNNIPVNHEQNSIYISYTTDAANGATDFNKQSLKVYKSDGQNAFTAIKTNWEFGTGPYTNYRLYVKKFQGADVVNEDELDKGVLSITAPTDLQLPCTNVADGSGIVQTFLPSAVKADANLIACFDVPTTVTNVEIGNLDDYSYYQVKVAVCRDGDCDVQDGASNQAILSEGRYERTSPNLAPFDGINFLAQSKVFVDKVDINFNAVVTSQGFANKLEVYCLDPNDF
jgi:hypothetical protein